MALLLDGRNQLQDTKY